MNRIFCIIFVFFTTVILAPTVRADESVARGGLFGWSHASYTNASAAAVSDSGIYSGTLRSLRPKARVTRRGIRLTCSNPFASLPFGFFLSITNKKATASFSNGTVFRSAFRSNKFSGRSKFGGRVYTLKFTLAKSRASAKVSFNERGVVAPGAVCDYPFSGMVFLVG